MNSKQKALRNKKVGKHYEKFLPNKRDEEAVTKKVNKKFISA